MSNIPHPEASHDPLIAGLTSDLQPVKRLLSPGMRALIWLGFVAMCGLLLSLIADLPAFAHRFMGSPDMWLSMTSSALTAVLAAIAAFKLSMPDSARAWAWLPVPTTVLWVVASGLGCLWNYFSPGPTIAPSHGTTMDCLVIIVALSVPFSLLMFAMLREAFSLLPALTATVAGLAVAAASATLLNLFHPFDAAAVDLLVHAFAVALVIVAIRTVGRRLWALPKFSKSE